MITALPTPPTRSDPATFAARGDAFMTALTTFVTEANDLAVAMNLNSLILATGISTFLTTPSSANLKAAVTDETGSGAIVFANTPTLVTPILGTPTSGDLSNCTGTASGLTAGSATTATTATTATAANGIKTATTTVSVSGSTAPVSGQVLIASSTTLAAWGNPTTTLNNVTAASGTATLANGNNAVAWNWAQTTASHTAYTIGETSAATNGVGSQVLCKIGTLANSTSDPLQVQCRATDVLRVSSVGAVTVTAVSPASGAGKAIFITSGGSSDASGGDINITAGTTTTTNAAVGGSINITAGNCASNSTGGSVTITAGTRTGTSSNGGSVSLVAGAGGTGMTGGDITLTPGAAASGTVGRVNFSANSASANGSVATVLGSVGPTGSNTTVQTWLTVKVAGTLRYIPCF